jgi:hypothetical protein
MLFACMRLLLAYADIRQHAPGTERASTRKGVVMRPTTGAIASSYGAVRKSESITASRNSKCRSCGNDCENGACSCATFTVCFLSLAFFLFLFFLVYFISCCFFNPGRRCVISFYFQLLKERENCSRDSGELAVKDWSGFSVCVFFVCVGLKQTQIC